jgi:RNA polymerase sigma factor (sigma-70 family)
MTMDLNPAEENFDTLLNWLDSDRERAGEKYEDIRHSLIKIFVWRGCNRAEDLADETIDRVMRKARELAKTYKGNPALYFYGVAKKVLLEHQRREFTPVSPLIIVNVAAPEPEDLYNQEDAKLDCLESCLQRLSQEDRDLILLYYQKEKQAKIDFRKFLAEQVGIETNTLRVRVYRIRNILHDCISKCLERHGRE